MSRRTVIRIADLLKAGHFLDDYTRTLTATLTTFNPHLRVFGVWRLKIASTQQGTFTGRMLVTEVAESMYSVGEGGIKRLVVDLVVLVFVLTFTYRNAQALLRRMAQRLSTVRCLAEVGATWQRGGALRITDTALSALRSTAATSPL